MLKLKPIVHAILKKYALPVQGIHGLAHWARVLETGVRLAKTTGANVEVVRLYAVFHDSRRVTVETDLSHGIRGAELAAQMRGKLFDLSEDDFDLLFVACAGHMKHPIDDDPTVQTCWDADRLDFGRVGAALDPLWLGEATVEEHQDIIQWADRRARAQIIPKLIQRDWGINTEGWGKPSPVKSGKASR